MKQATSIATHMVKEWGMSEKVGFRTIETNSSSLVVVNDLSPETSELIDSEIKRLLQVTCKLMCQRKGFKNTSN